MDAAPQPAPRRLDPQIGRIGVADVVEAFAAGLRDFQAAPLYGLFFGGIYALGGLFILMSVTRLGMPYLAYPLAAGFVLIGPFVAVGLYEVSRRRERQEALRWSGILGVVLAQGRRELSWMAFVALFLMMIWLYQVRLLLALFLGFQSFASFGGFLTVLATTPEGLMFLAVGNLVGAVLATVLFSLTVVSFPLLLDREVDFITAMITSVRAVALNPVPMLGFAAAIVALSVVAMLPAFLGLVVILPVLGHATWHLYRRVVLPPAPC
ncbi:hypothetical protein ASG72_14100 [Bosea sp. Leaf344]|nr:hypothetical protein ASG72_14100 [Bosea sp. Leaf344]